MRPNDPFTGEEYDSWSDGYDEAYDSILDAVGYVILLLGGIGVAYLVLRFIGK